jgi:hypothetical protein
MLAVREMRSTCRQRGAGTCRLRGGVRRGLPSDAGRHFRDSRPWVGAAAAERQPMPPRHSASVPLPPGGLQGPQLPRHGESMQRLRRGRFDSLLQREHAEATAGLGRWLGQRTLPPPPPRLEWRPCRA